jgi:hypothetical protein
MTDECTAALCLCLSKNVVKLTTSTSANFENTHHVHGKSISRASGLFDTAILRVYVGIQPPPPPFSQTLQAKVAPLLESLL